MNSSRPRWWHGKQGEWYVAAQLALIAIDINLISNAPRCAIGFQREANLYWHGCQHVS